MLSNFFSAKNGFCCFFQFTSRFGKRNSIKIIVVFRTIASKGSKAIDCHMLFIEYHTRRDHSATETKSVFVIKSIKSQKIAANMVISSVDLFC